MQTLSLRAWRNQGSYEGDWGVYGKVLTSGSPHNGWTPLHFTDPPPPTQNAKLILYASRAWRNQGRYEGDWGVYGKVLTSGSPHNGRTNPTITNHHSNWPTHVLPAGVSCRRPKAALLRVNIKCKNCPGDSGEPRQVWGVIGVSLERSWHQGHHTMDGPPLTPTHPHPPPQKHKMYVVRKTSPEEPGQTKAGTGVIGVSMQRSWHQGHQTMVGPPPHPTPPQKRKFYVIRKTSPEEPGQTKTATRVIGVSIERSWPQSQHKMDGPHPTATPHPHPT